MERLNKTESGMFAPCMISLLLNDLLFQNLLIVIATGVKCCAAVHYSLPVLHHSADYIFWFTGINELMIVCFEYTMPKSALGGVRDVALLSISHEHNQ